MSNILVIHPSDPSTDFLKPIYAPISNKIVITGGIDKNELRELIETHSVYFVRNTGMLNSL